MTTDAAKSQEGSSPIPTRANPKAQLNKLDLGDIFQGKSVRISNADAHYLYAVDIVHVITEKDLNQSSEVLRTLNPDIFSQDRFVRLTNPKSGKLGPRLLTIDDAITLIMVLPGKTAKVMRERFATIIRKHVEIQYQIEAPAESAVAVLAQTKSQDEPSLEQIKQDVEVQCQKLEYDVMRKNKEAEAAVRIKQAEKIMQSKLEEETEKAKVLAKAETEFAEAMAKAEYKAKLEVFAMEHQMKIIELQHQMKMKKRRLELEEAIPTPTTAEETDPSNMGVYVLRVDDGTHYYVGLSRNIKRRLEEHAEKFNIVETLQPHTKGHIEHLEAWELDETCYRIKEHGPGNVRGSKYNFPFGSTCNFSKEYKRKMFEDVCTHQSLCSRCGRQGHYISSCREHTADDWCADLVCYMRPIK